jgi:GR25 family glycosyltransferase involved in LPS biosynthesis
MFGIELLKPYSFLYEGFQIKQSSPYFTDAYVITLSSRYPERLKRIKENAVAAGITLKVWEGVIITKDDLPQLPEKGIGTLLFQDRTDTYFNFGAIGCYLAHRTLLESIAAAPNGLGTFICEDDIIIPKDFYTRFAAISSEIPENWDILFMRKYGGENPNISEHIKRIEKDTTATMNMGMWGFIVKNDSIQSKILPFLEQMVDAIDLQLNRYADKINMYVVDPPLISMDASHDDSIIKGMDIDSKK